jgi:hypothetical protein
MYVTGLPQTVARLTPSAKATRRSPETEIEQNYSFVGTVSS